MPATGDAERRRALRRIAREHHPDVGGDAETFIAAVAALTPPKSGASSVPTPPSRPATRVVLRLRWLLRGWLRARRDRRRLATDERLSARLRGGVASEPTASLDPTTTELLNPATSLSRPGHLPFAFAFASASAPPDENPAINPS